MSAKNMYDASPEQQKMMQWRDMKRRQLRELYLKESGHPTKSLLFDTALYRLSAVKASFEIYFIPRAINFIVKGGTILAFVALNAYNMKRRKNAREHLYRTGQVSYADRWNKFV